MITTSTPMTPSGKGTSSGIDSGINEAYRHHQIDVLLWEGRDC